jgi:predicted dehydrogenase
MKRHDPGTVRAKALLDELRVSGELGRILLLRAWCYGGEFRCDPADYVMTREDRPDGLATWPIAPDWLPPALAEDYAWFLNVFVHDLNIVRHLSGTEPTVSSVDLRRRNGRFVGLDFGDYPGVLEMADIPDQPWQEGDEMLFEKGALRLQFRSPLEHNSARLTLQRAGGTREIPPDSAAWCFRRQAEAFIADITQGREPLASGRDAVADLRLAEAIWRAHLRN